MELFFIGLVAAFASLLTFFSGFGLGTILTPAFILFFPPEIAIALTGVVHLLNNVFKIVLIGGHINWNVGAKFGAAAIAGSLAGAALLFLIADDSPLYSYTLNGQTHSVTLVKLVIALLLVIFSLFEVIPSSLKKIQLSGNKLIMGGLISGFFGGLSGNQGALRSIFLLHSGLSKESYIATGILIACMVDVSRLSVYFSRMEEVGLNDNLPIIVTAVLSAFTGAYIGSKLLKKVTMKFVQRTVATLIIILAFGLGTGLI